MNEQTKPTPGPWREGKTSDSIVADSGDGLGGHHRSMSQLIAESVAPRNKPLILLAPSMLQWLQQIALDRCTCDAWGTKAVEANPAEHDVWCMYREMTGYQDTAENPQQELNP